MNAIACSLVFVLLADAAPGDVSRCNRSDHACQAAKYKARAEAATTPATRAKYLEAAHRSFLALYDQTRSHEALCAARQSLEQTATALGPGAAELQLAPLHQQLAAREAAARPNCTATVSTSPGKGKKVARSSPRSSEPVIATPKQPAAEVQVVAEVQLEPSHVAATQTQSPAPPAPLVDTTERVELLAVPVRRALPRPAFDSAIDPTARRLLITGGVTIGVGFGLAAVAGYAGARLAHASRESFDLYAENQGQGDAAALAQEDALRHDHARWLPVTVTTAALSGTAVVVGAVLVAIGKRRAAAVTSRAALLPVPGGLAIRARF